MSVLLVASLFLYIGRWTKVQKQAETILQLFDRNLDSLLSAQMHRIFNLSIVVLLLCITIQFHASRCSLQCAKMQIKLVLRDCLAFSTLHEQLTTALPRLDHVHMESSTSIRFFLEWPSFVRGWIAVSVLSRYFH